MTDSILDSVKKMCNVAEDDPSFDQDLILYINSAFMTIMQEWHGMDHAFRVVDGSETWDDLLADDTDFEGVKELVGLKVRMVFDPPSNSSVMQALKDEIQNLEWRLYIWKDMDMCQVNIHSLHKNHHMKKYLEFELIIILLEI